MGSLNPPNDLYGHACSTGAGIRRHLGGGAGSRSVSRFRKGFRIENCHRSEAFDACCGWSDPIELREWALEGFLLR
jgi:hypothetical protein